MLNRTEHLLQVLSEEASEVSKDVSKSLRFGLNDRNVLNPTGPTNRERLIDELNDLTATVEMLVEHGVLPKDWCDTNKVKAKKAKVEKFIRYAHSVGAFECD